MVDAGDQPERVVAFMAKGLPGEGGAPTEGDPRRRCPDISFMKALTGWQPTISFDEGLTQTIAYFREEIGLDASPVKEVRQ